MRRNISLGIIRSNLRNIPITLAILIDSLQMLELTYKPIHFVSFQNPESELTAANYKVRPSTEDDNPQQASPRRKETSVVELIEENKKLELQLLERPERETQEMETEEEETQELVLRCWILRC